MTLHLKPGQHKGGHQKKYTDPSTGGDEAEKHFDVTHRPAPSEDGSDRLHGEGLRQDQRYPIDEGRHRLHRPEDATQHDGGQEGARRDDRRGYFVGAQGRNEETVHEAGDT